MKRLLCLIGLVLWVGLSPALATVRHIKLSCVNASTAFNATTGACTGSSATVYSSLANALTAGTTVAGDTLELWDAVYTERLNTNFQTLPSGTDLNAGVITIKAHSGTATFRPTGSGDCFNIVSANHHIRFDHIVIDGSQTTGGEGISFGGAVHDIEWVDGEVKDPWNVCIFASQSAGANLRFIRMKLHGAGRDGNGYGFYMENDDSFWDGVESYGNTGLGGQFYNGQTSGDGTSDRHIFQNGFIHDNFNGAQGAGGIAVDGNNNQIRNTVIKNIGGCISQGYSPASGGNKFDYNTLTCEGAGLYFGVFNPDSTGNYGRNNIIRSLTNTAGSITNGAQGTILQTNQGCAAGCTSSSDPMFTSFGGNNFTLLAGSPAIGRATDIGITVDKAGNARPQGTSFDIGAYQFIDANAPMVTMTGPASGSTVSGTAVQVSANASDNVGVLGVQFKLDGVNLGVEDTVAPYCMVWNSTMSSNALHVITAVARDGAGNSVTSAAISVTVNNGGAVDASPTVSITSPHNGDPVSGTITVSATATDDVSVSGVQFKLDGANLGAEDTSFPYGVSWATTSVADGSHTLMAVARDGAGHTTTSTPVGVTVNNPPPTISAIAAGSITTSSAVITWTTSTASDSQVEYGTTTAYGASTVLNPSLVTSHSETIFTGLSAFTLYHYRVKSRDILGQLATSGDNTFTTAASGATTLTITFPAGGETWIKGQVKAITWTKSPDLSGNVRLLVSRNGGSTFKTIVNSVAAGALTANWTVTAPSCNNCLIRINSLVNPSVFDNSATFIIKTQP
jgi:Bacterial Ig domain